MKKRLILCSLFCMLASPHLAFAITGSPTTCRQEESPKVIKPMENYDIIASNTGTIAMAPVFSGQHLTYSVSAHPHHRINKVTISKDTGVVSVKAEKKDNFDITVKVKNACGSAINTFNVIIDEDI